jgi:hypothetical protein
MLAVNGILIYVHEAIDYLILKLTNAWKKVLSKMLIVSQLVKKFPTFYGT